MPHGPIGLDTESFRRMSAAVREVEARRGEINLDPRQRPRTSVEPREAFVVVRTRDFESEGEILTVTPVWREQQGPKGPWVLKLRNDETTDVWTWPGLKVKHYAALAWLGETIEPGANILPVRYMLDRWHVEQVVRWGFPLRDQTFRQEGCLPVVV